MPHSIDGVCSFAINHDIPCLMVQWHGYATSTQIRKVAESQLQLMKEHKLTKVLSDNKELKGVSMEDQQWIITEWLPRALRIGYSACATLLSKDYFNRIVNEDLVSKVGDQLTIQYFDDVEKAAEWLKSIE